MFPVGLGFEIGDGVLEVGSRAELVFALVDLRRGLGFQNPFQKGRNKELLFSIG